MAIGGVACTHMTKVVYNQQKTTAEIYATGKHNNSSLFEFATVPQEESSSALVQFLILNDSEQLTIVQELLNTLQTPSGPTSVSKVYALVDLLSAIAKEKGILSVVSKEIISLVKKVVDGTNNSLSKEGAMLLLLSLLKKFQKEVEPLLSSLLLKIFQLHGDRSAVVRDSAALLTSELMQMVNPHSFRLQYNSICLAIVEEDWKVRVAGLNALKELANREDVRRHVTLLLPDLIPKVSECMLDSKRQVRN